MQFAFDDFLKFWFVYNGVYILFFLSVVDLSKTVKKLSPLRSIPAFVVQVLNVLSLKWDEVFSNVRLRHALCLSQRKSTLI